MKKVSRYHVYLTAAVLFVCIGGYELFYTFLSMKSYQAANSITLPDLINVYITNCALYFGVAILLYQAGIQKPQVKEGNGSRKRSK